MELINKTLSFFIPEGETDLYKIFPALPKNNEVSCRVLVFGTKLLRDESDLPCPFKGLLVNAPGLLHSALRDQNAH